MVLRLVAIGLIGIWFILVMLGKSGFVHVLLLTALGVAFVDVLYLIRSRSPAE